MSGQNRIFLFLSCLLLVCCTGASTAKADCADLVKQFNAAFSSRSLADVQALGTKIATDGGCDDLVIAKTQRARATLQFDQAKVLIKRGAPPSEYDALLADASKVLWDAAVQIGNDKSTQRQFVEATIAYERALELIKNEKLTPNQAAPDKKMIKAIFDSAAESRSLAANEESRSGRATYVPTAKDHRSGFLGGTMSISIRDFTPVTVPIPIRFETASSKFTENGQKAANDLLLALRQQAPAQITLVGHTDERGEANYNMGLSDERVKALAAFLKQNGITAKITTVAKGESEPLQVTNPQYRPEDIWALNRRVEWKRE